MVGLHLQVKQIHDSIAVVFRVSHVPQSDCSNDAENSQLEKFPRASAFWSYSVCRTKWISDFSRGPKSHSIRCVRLIVSLGVIFNNLAGVSNGKRNASSSFEYEAPRTENENKILISTDFISGAVLIGKRFQRAQETAELT